MVGASVINTTEARDQQSGRMFIGRIAGILGNGFGRGGVLVMLTPLDHKQGGDDREDESADINPKQVFFTGHSDFSIESSIIDAINPMRDVMKTNGFALGLY